MTIDIIKRMLQFVVLCLVQALVLNHVSLFGYATPMLYVWLVITLPHGISRTSAMLWAFALGFVIDIFSNTPGMASASLTILAAVQPTFFSLFLQHDAPADLRPSIRTMGGNRFSFYVFTLVVLHCIVFFSLEAFSFLNWPLLLKSIIGSAVLTFILILTLENFRRK